MEKTYDKNLLLEAYRKMTTIRAYESKVEEIFLAGELPGFTHLYIGEEACGVGVCSNLNKDDYIDFNAVTAAIDAVVRDKDYTEQLAVDAMAKAIEDAIKALQLKPTPETTTTIPETTTTEQVTTNQETTTVEQVPTTSRTEATTVEQVSTTSRTEATTTMVNPTETETQYITTSVNDNTPKTGENSNITLWMIVFFITAGGILTITLEKRKEDKQ